jgi:hypothetical protein
MKIQLPDFVLADLYKNSLVIADPILPAMPLSEPESAPALYLGGNNKQVAVLVNDNKNRFIDEECLQLLTNMLSALQLSLQDVAVINIHVTPLDYKQMDEQLRSHVCLMFAVSTQEIGLPFQMPDYKVQTFSNCKFLSIASLYKMKGESKEAKLEKTKLWMCLKTIFE